MSKTYLLIDLQNRHPQPEDVSSWMGSNGEAWIFYGEQEIGLLAPYMELGDRVSLVDISKPGKNSPDFHLVLYLGYLIGRNEPGARFVIVAADGDYDPAIVHARSKSRQVERVEVLGPALIDTKPTLVQSASLPQPAKVAHSPVDKVIVPVPVPVPLAPKSRRSKSVDQVFLLMLRDFAEAGKPRSLSALERRIQSRFGPEPVPEKVASVKAALVMKGAIKIADETIEYRD